MKIPTESHPWWGGAVLPKPQAAQRLLNSLEPGGPSLDSTGRSAEPGVHPRAIQAVCSLKR